MLSAFAEVLCHHVISTSQRLKRYSDIFGAFSHHIYLFTVTEAESGMEALEILRSNAPGTFSLVLTVSD